MQTAYHGRPCTICNGTARTKRAMCVNNCHAKIWKEKNRERHRAINREWGQNNLTYNTQRNREWRANNPGKQAEYSLRRKRKDPVRYSESLKAAQLKRQKRMPLWADRSKILEFYRLADVLTRETGVPHEVDHIFPLCGKLISGLHVHENLQVIPAVDNRRKSNLVCQRAATLGGSGDTRGEAGSTGTPTG